jgi:hypothetical protein
MINKKGEKKRLQRNERKINKEKIVMAIITILFFHKLAHVASQGSSILRF